MIEIPRHPDFSKNQSRIKGENYPCIICGKAVSNPNPWMVHLFWGTHLVMEDEVADLDTAGDMYHYPVGGNCLKNHPELKSYARKL